MKGDLTRSTFRPQKHYSGIRMQQGRVQLDADWNEQVDITAHRVESETSDIIGRYGVPFEDPGFKISGGAFPLIGMGHLYLDGILVENDKDVLISQQSEFLPGYTPPKTAGEYLAYLDVWERHVTVLEDPLIREVALGGPDTATRSQTVWQARLIGPLAAPLVCSSLPAAWQQVVDFVPGKLRVHTASGTISTNLCEVPAGAGYRRLENQLYRVEVHIPGGRGTATFKWSRDNGSIMTAWNGQDGNDLIVTSLGRDQWLGFAAGQTVELTDDDHELRGETGVLVKLSKAEGQVLTLDPSAPSVDRSTFGRNPKVRRWDSDGDILTSGNWIPLEDGVEVFFEAGCDYKVGDYWMIPARTAESDVEWPADETNPANPAAVVRQGIAHHYCRLATLHCDGTNFTVTGDCRPKFPPLTMLNSLYYVGGDGQEAMPGIELAQWLEVRVAAGGWVLEGATVRFTASGNGRLSNTKGGTAASTVNTMEVDSGADGIARCVWKPEADLTRPSQQVTALLIDADGNLVKDEHGNLVHVLRFTANLSIAGQVAYESGKCLLSAHTVKEALDQLCQNVTLYYVGGDGQETMPGEWLPQPLQVRVANGDFPVSNARVVFEVAEGGGRLVEGGQCGAYGNPAGIPATLVSTITNPNGLASCCWKLDNSKPSQRVKVKLEGAGSPLVFFNASLLKADRIAYRAGDCELLKAADTVQEALDILCAEKTAKGCCVTVGAGGDYLTLDAALGQLLGNKQTEISICLLADAKIEMGGFENDPNLIQSPTHIAIKGCAESLVELKGPLTLHRLASFRMRDVKLVIPQFGDEAGFIEFDQCNRIILEDCTMDGNSEYGSLLRVKEANWVTFRDSIFRLQNQSEMDKYREVVRETPFEKIGQEAVALRSAVRNQIAKNYIGLAKDKKSAMLSTIANRLTSGEIVISASQKLNYEAFVATLQATSVDFALVKLALGAILASAAATAGVAIIFDDAKADIVMENNYVQGGISMYGVPDKSFATDELIALLGKLKPSWKEGNQNFTIGTSFHLRGNHLDRIWLGRELVEALRKLDSTNSLLTVLFSEFFASDNVFWELDNHIIAGSLGFHSNQASMDIKDAIWAVTLAEVAAFTGNRAALQSKILYLLSDPPGAVANLRVLVAPI